MRSPKVNRKTYAGRNWGSPVMRRGHFLYPLPPRGPHYSPCCTGEAPSVVVSVEFAPRWSAPVSVLPGTAPGGLRTYRRFHKGKLFIRLIQTLYILDKKLPLSSGGPSQSRSSVGTDVTAPSCPFRPRNGKDPAPDHSPGEPGHPFLVSSTPPRPLKTVHRETLNILQWTTWTLHTGILTHTLPLTLQKWFLPWIVFFSHATIIIHAFVESSVLPVSIYLSINNVIHSCLFTLN